ncbi:hypothetical protein GALL_293610 [mine drainage metagenome]|uniref:DUF6457 domain-containing protein n=1 Tax=mine drainage metagenome TaxID=410659 RepID=A0A1J5R9H2_9ZZZZ
MNEYDAREAAPDPADDAVRWAALVTAELDIPGDDLGRLSRSVLDMVRDVAHGVNRPSAPLTAFLVGLAAGRAAQANGAQIDVEVQTRLDQVMHLVQSWQTANEQ